MEEKKAYTISVYTENNLGLMNRISAIFLKRHINLESITASQSEIKNVFIDSPELTGVKIMQPFLPLEPFGTTACSCYFSRHVILKSERSATSTET